ncbi:hypothetical protein Q73_03630 [Bacillus coahuilensis m2-6]|uniref:sensor histidine kinase n=1 Tax=Bacillus coahuilensis TaxID=408580 RepID=UPI0007505851|nr:HAMP domain-containing sensor histidine kinase [Bacillus coahuilensis]KUP09174.1 hypothetical protein Q73_03630 [Bacillus coahuilensis m2-6]
MRKLAGKLLLLLLGMLLVTILVSFTLTGFLYERLYVNSIKEELVQYGENVSLDYDGGDVSDIFVWNVEYLNEKTRFEIFAVRNPRELSACVPFEIDYNALIGSKERAQLLDGQSVIDVGYEERFKRDLVSVVVPLLDEDRLEGILYLYYPLENIQELTENYALLWVLCIFLFSMIISVIGAKGVSYVINPLLEMKDAAKNISRGDLTSRVNVSSRDEIGELAETFNKMAESLEKEDERNKEFLATVSHELRTPITYIKGYNEALQMNLGTEIERAQYFQLISRETSRLDKMVNELLDMMKLETGNFHIELEPIALAETVRQAVDSFKSFAESHGIDVLIELNEDIIVQGDEGRIHQILHNLLRNSLQYMNGSGTIQITLDDSLSREEAVLTVSDTGIGIPEEHLPFVTERFYRVNKARTRSDGGSGLGLAIVSQLVELHNGRLIITSKVNEGTTVEIRLPLIVTEDG